MIYFQILDAEKGSLLILRSNARLCLTADMPEVDHSIGKQFQAKMMKTNPFKSQQKPFELILPGEDTLNRSKAFLKNFLIINPLSSSFRFLTIPWVFFDIGDHARIEDFLPVCKTIVSGIKAYYTFLQRSPHARKEIFQRLKCFSKQRSLMTIARDNRHGRPYIAIAIHKNHNLLALHVFVSAKS